VLLVSGGGGDDTPAPADQATPAPSQQTPAASGETTVSPADTTVAVLNGTTISGLARGVADDLRDGGFKVPDDLVSNAVEQNRSATVVNYAEGAREEARAVAEQIDVGSDAIAPVDRNTQTLGGRAKVVVIVGADQQNQNQAQP
jgi:hypothetical protein